MTTPEDEALIEATTTAWRPRSSEGHVTFHPAWHDLDRAGREEAFDAVFSQRLLEAALDPAGLSSTAKAVLNRIRR
jgi:hypothetical protein